MSVLGWMTLVWAGVLVVAVAASLTAIALLLRRIGGLLGEAREALERVREHTAGVARPLEALEQGAARLSGAMRSATEAVEEAEAAMGATVDRGATAASR